MTAPLRKIVVDGPMRGDAFRLIANGPPKLWSCRLSFSDFSAAATTGNKDLATFPANISIEGAFIILRAVFAGGAVSAATVSVGTTGSATAYIAATNVWTGATAPGYITGQAAGFPPGTFLGAINALGTVRVALVTTSANTNALTAGYLDLYLRLRAVGQP